MRGNQQAATVICLLLILEPAKERFKEGLTHLHVVDQAILYFGQTSLHQTLEVMNFCNHMIEILKGRLPCQKQIW